MNIINKQIVTLCTNVTHTGLNPRLCRKTDINVRKSTNVRTAMCEKTYIQAHNTKKQKSSFYTFVL